MLCYCVLSQHWRPYHTWAFGGINRLYTQASTHRRMRRRGDGNRSEGKHCAQWSPPAGVMAHARVQTDLRRRPRWPCMALPTPQTTVSFVSELLNSSEECLCSERLMRVYYPGVCLSRLSVAGGQTRWQYGVWARESTPNTAAISEF